MSWFERLQQDLAGLVLPLAIFAVLCAIVLTSALLVVAYHRRSMRKQREKVFPIVVPGIGMRLSSAPPFKATVDDVADALLLLIAKVVDVKLYDRARVTEALGRVNVAWVPADTALFGIGAMRHIRDEFGRVIAGDQRGDTLRVVYRNDDRLGNTAFVHECGHLLHTLEKLVDDDHKDERMWKQVIEPIDASIDTASKRS